MYCNFLEQKFHQCIKYIPNIHRFSVYSLMKLAKWNQLWSSTEHYQDHRSPHYTSLKHTIACKFDIEFFFHCVTANCQWLQPPNPVGARSPLQCTPCCGRFCPGFTLQFPGGHTQTVCFNTQGNSSFICCSGSAWGMDCFSEFSNSYLSTVSKFKNCKECITILCTFMSIFERGWVFNCEIILLICRN